MHLVGPAAMVLQAGGTVTSTIGQVQAARTEADIAEQQAISIREQAGFEERQSRREARRILGKQLATTAAAGVSTTSGSPLMQQLDLVRQAELNAEGIRRRGQMGFEAKRFEAKSARARIPGIIAGGASSILGGMFQARAAKGIAPTTGGRPQLSPGQFRSLLTPARPLRA